VGAGIAVVATGRIDIRNMAFPETGHLHDVGGIAAQAPARFVIHGLLQFLPDFIPPRDGMGQHREVEVLGDLPAGIVGTAPGRAQETRLDILVQGLREDAHDHVLIQVGIMPLVRAVQVGGSPPDLPPAAPAGVDNLRIRSVHDALLGQDVLPLRIAGEVVEESRGHLLEITSAHGPVADALVIVQLGDFLPGGEPECLDGLVGIEGLEVLESADAEGLRQHGAVGGIGPGGHGRAAGLEHDGPVLVGVGHALGIGLPVPDGQEEVHFVPGLVDEVGNAVPAFPDAQVVLREASAGEDIREEHVIDVAHVGQVAVPVHSVGVAAADIRIHRIPGEPVGPEGRGLLRLEMGFVPDVAPEFPPVGMPGMEVGLIDGEALRVHAGSELRLAGNRPDMGGILGLLQAHIIVPAHGIPVGLEIDVVPDVEVHAAAHILHDQAIAAGPGAGEVDVPDIRAREVLLAGFELTVRLRLPETDLACLGFRARLDIVQPHFLAFEGLVIPGAAVAEPEIQVGRHLLLAGRITDDVHMDRFRETVPDVEPDTRLGRIGAAAGGDPDRIGMALFHGLRKPQEDPVFQFALEPVVPVHGLGLAGDGGLHRPEGTVVRRSDHPAGLDRIQPGEEGQEGVVPFDESVPEIGACTGPVVPVADVPVLEADDEGFLVDDLDAFETGRFRPESGKEARQGEGRRQHGFHFHKESRFMCSRY